MKPKPFMSEGWEREFVPETGIWKTTIPLTNVDMIASTEQLLVKTGLAFNEGDIIKIGDIEVAVINYDAAWKFPGHTWIVDIECNQMDELRELLTYEVVDNIPEIGKLSEK